MSDDMFNELIDDVFVQDSDMNQEIIKATLLEQDDSDILRFEIDEDEAALEEDGATDTIDDTGCDELTGAPVSLVAVMAETPRAIDTGTASASTTAATFWYILKPIKVAFIFSKSNFT